MTSIQKGSNAIKNVSLERHKKSLIKFETLYCLWPSLRSILSRFWVFSWRKSRLKLLMYSGSEVCLRYNSDPIKKLLIATNSNDVLHKLFSENNYEKSSVDQTLAPSMDISVASNFERLLYNLHDNNSDVLSSIMAQFPEKPISIPKEKWEEQRD